MIGDGRVKEADGVVSRYLHIEMCAIASHQLQQERFGHFTHDPEMAGRISGIVFNQARTGLGQPDLLLPQGNGGHQSGLKDTLDPRQNSGALHYRQDLTILSDTPFSIRQGMGYTAMLISGKRDRGSYALGLLALGALWLLQLLARLRRCYTSALAIPCS